MKIKDKIIISLILGTFLLLSLIVIFVILVAEIRYLEPQYTTFYENVNISHAKEIINSTTNLSIIDVRGLEGCSHCQFRKGHLPNATMYNLPDSFFNTTNDILVYSRDGKRGETFCEQLVNHTYGKIYNLEGGWNAWNQ